MSLDSGRRSIQEDCTSEVAATLGVLHREVETPNLERNEKPPLGGGKARHGEIETAISTTAG
jgi:hypothetical protein